MVDVNHEHIIAWVPKTDNLELYMRIGRFVLAIEQLAQFPVSSPKPKPAPTHRRSRGGQYTRG